MDDKRLIEDYLPIEAISKEASREKSVRKGHISTLHLWWARRPLVACRAAVYGALVPASQFVPNANSDVKKKSLGRANAAKFITGLCKYPGAPHYIAEAQHHILAAHANRLSQEIAAWKAGKTGEPSWVQEFNFAGDTVTETDITEGRAPRPKVLDMFAGGERFRWRRCDLAARLTRLISIPSHTSSSFARWSSPKSTANLTRRHVA